MHTLQGVKSTIYQYKIPFSPFAYLRSPALYCYICNCKYTLMPHTLYVDTLHPQHPQTA